MPAHVARLAGEAIGLVHATVVDALVMAAASIRSDTVYTSDPGDLQRLLEVFPAGFAKNLDEVVDFYNSRFDIKLAYREKADLVAFLRSL